MENTIKIFTDIYIKLNKGKGPESKIQVLREHAHLKVFGRTGDASSN